MVIDAAARRVVATIPAGPQAHQVVATPDGRRAWAVNVAAKDLLEVNIAGGTFAPGRRFSSGGVRPIALVFTADG